MGPATLERFTVSRNKRSENGNESENENEIKRAVRYLIVVDIYSMAPCLGLLPFKKQTFLRFGVYVKAEGEINVNKVITRPGC